MDNNIQCRMLKNLRYEANACVRNPKYKLPARNEEQTGLRQIFIDEEKKLFDAERTQELRERLTIEFGSDWEEWARSLYIDSDGTIQSKARAWKEPVFWPYATEFEKLKKIEQLVRYKIYDRARGHGDIETDLLQQQ